MSEPTILNGLEELDGYYAGIAQHFNKNADYYGLLSSFQGKLEDLHAGFFASESDPSGSPWLELERSTIRKKGHDTILYETGRLENSLVGKTSDSIREIVEEGANHGLTFGTSVPYSIYHFDGSVKNKRGQEKIREHVGIGDKELDAITDDVAERTLEIVMEA